MLKYYQLKIRLVGAESKVWRSFIVESDISLGKFQKILRCVMGWSGLHDHYFKMKDGWKQYVPELKEDSECNCFSYEEMVLSDFLQSLKDVLVYVYDSCDLWEHNITIEKHYSDERMQRNPYCISGQGVCPHEDCGGMWGYLEMMRVMQDPYAAEFENVKKWLGGWLNRQFSCNDVNNHFDNAGLYNERAGLPGIPDFNRVNWRDMICEMDSKQLVQNCRTLGLDGTGKWTVSMLVSTIMEALKRHPMLLTKILSRDDFEYLKFLLDARTTVKWNKGDKSAARLVKYGLAAFHLDVIDQQLYVYTAPELGVLLEAYWTKIFDSPQVKLYDRWDRVVCGILFYYGVLSSRDLHKRWHDLVSKPLNYGEFMAYLKKRTRLQAEVIQVSKNGVNYCCHYMMDFPEETLERVMNYTTIAYKPFTVNKFYEAGAMDYILQCKDMQKIKMYLELNIADPRMVKNLVIESWRCVQNGILPAQMASGAFKREIEAGILDRSTIVYHYFLLRNRMRCWRCRGHRRYLIAKMRKES